MFEQFHEFPEFMGKNNYESTQTRAKLYGRIVIQMFKEKNASELQLNYQPPKPAKLLKSKII